MTEFFFMFGHVFRYVIAEPGCHGSTGARNDSDDDTDDGREQRRAGHALVLVLCDLSVIHDL